MLLKISPHDVVKSLSRDDCELLIEICMGRIRDLDAIRLNENEMELIRNHDKIGAIYSLRRRTGASLADAKAVVDSYMADYRMSIEMNG